MKTAKSAPSLEKSASRELLIATIIAAVLFALAAFWARHLALEDERLSAETQRLEQRWASTARELEQTRRTETHLRTFLETTARLTAERARDQWASALRGIATSACAGIEPRVIHAWKNPDDPHGRLLQLEGSAQGANPRTSTDRFRQQLQVELKREFALRAPCRIEQLDDQPGSPGAVAGQNQATFTITAAISTVPIAPIASGPET